MGWMEDCKPVAGKMTLRLNEGFFLKWGLLLFFLHLR